ncbi:MAG TPA: hypothetical protein PKN13_01080 [Accumulibacter sp.]|mgnify:CR=1|nr:hypothetical protein [Accumulibacter sp.]HMW16352.1 hypothetical protein [Accumulibacter sp.]HMX22219.1 hypothetical protein [Accumulibacter sp.]HMY06359.1 hypothetical protein [Accumulibacter sp.]HNC17363.1 hypothetical protein [Accumulibacter sp.]
MKNEFQAKIESFRQIDLLEINRKRAKTVDGYRSNQSKSPAGRAGRLAINTSRGILSQHSEQRLLHERLI